jgi:hypothetical protein
VITTGDGIISAATFSGSSGAAINVSTRVDVVTGLEASGGIVLAEADSIVLDNVVSAQGSITVTAGGTITALGLVTEAAAGNNLVSLAAPSGDIAVGDIDAGTDGRVVLSCAGEIVSTGGTIRADSLTADAAGSISLRTSVESIFATNGGVLSVTEADGVTLVTDAAELTLTTEGVGDVQVTEEEDIVLDGVAVADGSFTLTAHAITVAGPVQAL